MAGRYHGISEYLKEKYKTKVYRLSLSSGCSCPNRDGRVGVGGCNFCSEGGSGDFAAEYTGYEVDDIAIQLEYAKSRVAPKLKGAQNPKYIAYFQSYSNTYYKDDEDLQRLERLYTNVISRPEICILSIGTRPDCIDDNVIKMLRRLSNVKPVWVELGLQTIHEKTAKSINRGYELAVFDEAYNKLTAAGIDVIVHMILGLPGESKDMMLKSVKYLSDLSPTLFGIKLQLLHVLKGTRLADEYVANHFPVMELDEYCNLVAECIALLPDKTTVHRITGDGPKSILIAPEWSADKKRVINALKRAVPGYGD